MKKLFFLLYFIPLVSFGQKFEDDLKDFEAFEKLIIIDSESTIDRFGFFKEKPWIMGDHSPSFFKGSWWGYLQNNPIIYLLERAFGSSVFNSGPHKENLNPSSNDFGHYNPLFLEKAIGSFKSLSPISKKIIQPFYDSHFKGQLKELMQNRISVYFSNDSNKNFLEKIKNRYDHNLLVQEIKTSNLEIPFETLFWIRRDYDGTSDKFLTLFELIIEEFDKDAEEKPVEAPKEGAKKDVNKFPGTDSYTSYEGKSTIYDYNSYKIITTPWSNIMGPDYADIMGSQIMAISKDDMSVKYIGESISQFDFGGVVKNFMILLDREMSVDPGFGFNVFDLKNQKYVFYGFTYSGLKIVNSKIEFYMRIDSDKEFNKPQCLKGSTNPYLFVDGYVEKVIFDLSNLELQRTGVYDCIIQGY